MKRPWYQLLIFILLLWCIFPCCTAMGQNVALHKPYTLSVVPNYDYTAPASNNTALTDGVFSKDQFWTQKTTVGWKYKTPIRITIDLGSVIPIGSVNLSSAAGVSDVYFAKNIYVFGSKDGNTFRYIGDAAALTKTYGHYKHMAFRLNNVNINTRYVSFVVVPKGAYFFVDEIQIMVGNSDNDKVGKSIEFSTIETTLNFVENNQRTISQVYPNGTFTSSTNNAIVYTKFDHKSLASTDNDNNYGQQLSNLYHTPFVIEKQSPWSSVSNQILPKGQSGGLSYTYSLPMNGVSYGAFTITNTSGKELSYKISISGKSTSSAELFIFRVPFAKPMRGAMVADPLVPITSKSTLLVAGASEMIFFKLEGHKPGRWASLIKITAEEHSETVQVNAQVNAIHLNTNLRLNTNVWAYLNYPMLKDRKAEAVRDLKEHHINTIVVPPVVLPPVGETDFSKLKVYLKPFKQLGEVKNILLFTNFNGRKIDRLHGFLSSQWKEKFKLWYYGVSNVLSDEGFGHAKLYFYPYDEVSNESDITAYEELIIWAKQKIPEIKFYATFTQQAAVKELLPKVDVAQIYDYKGGDYQLPEHQAEIWSYKIATEARRMDPYSFYRLMAWQAYAENIKGIGFWNYADNGSSFSTESRNLLMNINQKPLRSYSVIYNGSGLVIVSSRRWEAFKIGIEDYELLKAYESKFGRTKTMIIVKKVIDNSQDTEAADIGRTQLIKGLSK